MSFAIRVNDLINMLKDRYERSNPELKLNESTIRQLGLTEHFQESDSEESPRSNRHSHRKRQSSSVDSSPSIVDSSDSSSETESD